MVEIMSLIKKEEKHILEVLPLLIKKDRKFRGEFYGVLTETFATKEEFNRVLEELRILREDTNKRFDQVDRRLNQVDRRLDQVDRRLDEVDRRLDQVDRRLDEVDRRLDQVDRRLDEVDRRLEDQEDWVGVVVGGFQRRAGRSLEDAIAGTLRAAMKRRDIKPENLTIRRKIKDEEGIIGPKDRTYEIDLYIYNSESILFEVKSYIEPEDVLRFNDKAQLTIEKMKLSNPLKVIVSLEKGREVSELCKEVGIMLV